MTDTPEPPPAKRPVRRLLDQSGHPRVIHDVKTDLGKRPPLPVFLAQHLVVRLVLKAMRTQRRAEMFAQKLHAVELVTVKTQSHPDQMNVVGHQAIGRAKKPFARGGVQHDFTKFCVKRFVQPAGAALGNWQRPVNDGVGLIKFSRQSGKIKAAVGSLTGVIGIDGAGFRFHAGKVRAN